MTERKTEAINLRMSPTTKEMLRLAAGAEHRTLSNMLEVLILEYCERHGIRAAGTADGGTGNAEADKAT